MHALIIMPSTRHSPYAAKLMRPKLPAACSGSSTEMMQPPGSIFCGDQLARVGIHGLPGNHGIIADSGVKRWTMSSLYMLTRTAVPEGTLGV